MKRRRWGLFSALVAVGMVLYYNLFLKPVGLLASAASSAPPLVFGSAPSASQAPVKALKPPVDASHNDLAAVHEMQCEFRSQLLQGSGCLCAVGATVPVAVLLLPGASGHGDLHPALDAALLILMGGEVLDPCTTEVMQAHMGKYGGKEGSEVLTCPCKVPSRLRTADMLVVEIGAHDGVQLSNSHFFEKAAQHAVGEEFLGCDGLGWQAMCVEPNPSVWTDLQANRPGCITVQAVVSASQPVGSNVSFTVYSSHRKKTQAAMFSTVKNDDPDYRLHVRDQLGSWVFQDEVNVTADRFDRLFRQHSLGHVEVLSVDVEGSEHDVISSVDFGAVHVHYVLFENNEMYPEVISDTITLLKNAGFEDITDKLFSDHDLLFANPKYCTE
eukprot:gene1101-2650_t